MTGLATMINSREKELTYEAHRELLKTHMANVKSLTPVLISGIKIFITTQGMGKLIFDKISYLFYKVSLS